MNVHVIGDRIIGRATRFFQGRLDPSDDTTAQLEAYRNRRPSVLLPPPFPNPRVQAADRGAVGPFRSRVLRFRSDHLPLPEAAHGPYRFEQDPLHSFRARQLVLKGKPSRRAVIYVHGWMEASYLFTEHYVAPNLARRLGADVYHFELPHHWSRQLPGSRFNGSLFLTADLVRTVEAFRQGVLDTRTLLQWILNSGRYDEVGLVGISLGSLVTQMTLSVEPRVSWAIPMMGHLDLGDILRHAEIVQVLHQELLGFGVAPEAIDALVDAIGLRDLKPRGKRERIFFVAAEDDQFMTAAAMRRQVERWEGIRDLWVPGGHLTGLRHLPRILDRLRQDIDALSPRLLTA